MNSQSAIPNKYSYQIESNWSKSEKAIARKAFDAALKRELQEVMQKAKRMANQCQDPADLWDLENYLKTRRTEIDRKYDYRYSQLTSVFGRLLSEKRLTEEDVRGLREDKLQAIRSFAKFLADDTAA
jgi:hypothetical protein